MTNVFTVFTDGGSRGNPGPSAIGFIIYDSNNEKLEQQSKYIGEKTNNYAEYLAILESLINLKKYNPDEVVIYTDSSLAYNQINGFWKIKDEDLKKMILQINKEIVSFKQFKIFHIPREKNKEADRLVNIELNLNAIK
ncbi:MAG: ribonuclease HI family protein [Actinobacteria bacterium]|nr:ribonuclease HI family protein [Actinomycetota bacterium]